MTKPNYRNMEIKRQIAEYFKLYHESQITRCEEWANVWFVVIEGKGGRFVSKTVVKHSECQIKELTDPQTGKKCWGIVSPKGGCFGTYKTLKAAQKVMATTAASYVDWYAASASGSIIYSGAVGNYHLIDLTNR
jgi:hypothetical protein